MATINELKSWLRAMSERGVYGGAAARVRGTAIEQLASVLGTDEPNDPAWLLANIDAIANRWATKHHANPGTANTYKSRAKSTLAEFLEYTQDPSRFRGPRGRKPTRPQTTKKVPGAESGADIAPDAAVAPLTTGQVQSFTFALSSGSGRLTVPFPLTAFDIRIIKKQVELLELQAGMAEG